MKKKTLFHLKVLKEDTTHVYVLLPEINNLNFDVLSCCFEFINKFQRLTFLCTSYEVSFYRLLLNKSKTVVHLRDKIQFDIINHIKFKEIQMEECLIVDISKRQDHLEVNKKAIYCLPEGNSDIIFKEADPTNGDPIIFFLKSLYNFLEIPEQNLLKRIEISPEDIIKASTITSKLKGKQYSVIILKSLIETIKISKYLKKNKLKKPLILITKSKVSATDPLLSTHSDHNYLDFLAFQLEAVHISCPKSDLYEKVISNLRINLSLFASFKESSQLLFDITEPKVNA